MQKKHACRCRYVRLCWLLMLKLSDIMHECFDHTIDGQKLKISGAVDLIVAIT